MSKERCIMPNMPYCPSCKYGNVVYKDEDYDGYETPTDCEWSCLLPDTRPMEEIKKELLSRIEKYNNGNNILYKVAKFYFNITREYMNEAVRTHEAEMDLLRGELEDEIYELESKLKKYEQVDDDCE